MLKRFAQTQGIWMEEIDKLLVQDQREDARRETHTLKGLAGNIGAMALFNLTKEIEEKLKDADNESAKLLIPLAKEELSSVIKNITNFFADAIEAKQEHHTLESAEIEELKHNIKKIVTLLDEYDSQAVSEVEKITPLLEDLGLAKEAQALLQSINAYEFEAAKEILLGCKI